MAQWSGAQHSGMERRGMEHCGPSTSVLYFGGALTRTTVAPADVLVLQAELFGPLVSCRPLR